MTYLLTVIISLEHTELEKTIEEVLKKFMDDKSIYEGVQASLTRGLQASHSIGHHSKHVKPVSKKQSKNRDDIANSKQIPSFLLDYISPLNRMVNHYIIPQDFKYNLIIAYIPKGIYIVGTQLG
jgi:hypothetical protein